GRSRARRRAVPRLARAATTVGACVAPRRGLRVRARRLREGLGRRRDGPRGLRALRGVDRRLSRRRCADGARDPVGARPRRRGAPSLARQRAWLGALEAEGAWRELKAAAERLLGTWPERDEVRAIVERALLDSWQIRRREILAGSGSEVESSMVTEATAPTVV